jgi:hypothetical protein
MTTSSDTQAQLQELQERFEELLAIKNTIEVEKENAIRENERLIRTAGTPATSGSNPSPRVRKDLGLQSLVKIFSGENGQSVEEFLQNLKLVSETGNWEERNKKFICRLKVTGPAAACLDAHPELSEETATFADFVPSSHSTFFERKRS